MYVVLFYSENECKFNKKRKYNNIEQRELEAPRFSIA